MDSPHRQPVPVIIDTDPGIDDVVALALAARSPELEIVAVTTTYGNATLGACSRNAREVLRLAGRAATRVLPGSAQPLARPLVTAPETHGATGVGYAPVPAVGLADAVANDRVLLDVLADEPVPVVLVTLGPLTNLAHALAADAGLVEARVQRHIGMFGNLHERGNTNRWADFNAWCDPEAVDVVLRSNLDTLMVGLDVTRRIVLSASEVSGFRTTEDALTRWLAHALTFYVEFHRSQERLDGCVVNDPVTIGELLHPGLLGIITTELGIELDDGEHRGHTKERPGGSPTSVAMEVDVAGMRGLLERVLGPMGSEAIFGGMA